MAGNAFKPVPFSYIMGTANPPTSGLRRDQYDNSPDSDIHPAPPHHDSTEDLHGVSGNGAVFQANRINSTQGVAYENMPNPVTSQFMMGQRAIESEISRRRGLNQDLEFNVYSGPTNQGLNRSQLRHSEMNLRVKSRAMDTPINSGDRLSDSFPNYDAPLPQMNPVFGSAAGNRETVYAVSSNISDNSKRKSNERRGNSPDNFSHPRQGQQEFTSFERPDFSLYTGRQNEGENAAKFTNRIEQPPVVVRSNNHHTSNNNETRRQINPQPPSGECCYCSPGVKCCVVMSLILTILVCLAGGFVAGWFGYQASHTTPSVTYTGETTSGSFLSTTSSTLSTSANRTLFP